MRDRNTADITICSGQYREILLIIRLQIYARMKMIRPAFRKTPGKHNRYLERVPEQALRE